MDYKKECIDELIKWVKSQTFQDQVMMYQGIPVIEALEKLAELEDKIEQGLVIELPHMHYIERAGVWEIIYLKRGELWHYRCSYKAEAEAKLRELQGGKENV